MAAACASEPRAARPLEQHTHGPSPPDVEGARRTFSVSHTCCNDLVLGVDAMVALSWNFSYRWSVFVPTKYSSSL